MGVILPNCPECGSTSYEREVHEQHSRKDTIEFDAAGKVVSTLGEAGFDEAEHYFIWSCSKCGLAVRNQKAFDALFDASDPAVL